MQETNPNVGISDRCADKEAGKKEIKDEGGRAERGNIFYIKR